MEDVDKVAVNIAELAWALKNTQHRTEVAINEVRKILNGLQVTLKQNQRALNIIQDIENTEVINGKNIINN